MVFQAAGSPPGRRWKFRLRASKTNTDGPWLIFQQNERITPMMNSRLPRSPPLDNFHLPWQLMRPRAPVFILSFCVTALAPAADARNDSEPVRDAERWRLEHRTIDLHQHINATTQHLGRAVKIMDAAGIGLGVNLSGGTVTRTKTD